MLDLRTSLSMPQVTALTGFCARQHIML